MGSASSARRGWQLVCRSGDAKTAAAGAIRQPHACRWARSWPASAFLDGFDGADNGSSSSTGVAPRTRRGFHHISFGICRSLKKLSEGPGHAHVERWRMKLAGAALQVLQRRGSRGCSRVIARRCAAPHARVRACWSVLSVSCLNAPQDRCRVVLHSGHDPRRLSIPTARAAHASQRACGRRRLRRGVWAYRACDMRVCSHRKPM